ncbi:uncharacterized protein LOC115436104 isoform X2 [Sphaeramia orbicularis]|uniref:uncharacterized protein LOC115436104 isoform X2 n=1 Tax=Sphaeramia orbicularis TaxID=375764 RepID=UPI0011802975|nr:uncharacterized protein LOC115436104 isoform X2 [Sphaeramia orbicularis]
MKRRGERGSSPLLSSPLLSLRALTVECSAGDRAVRVRWLLSLIRPAHSRSSAQHTAQLQKGRATNWHIQHTAATTEQTSSGQGGHRDVDSSVFECYTGSELQVVTDRVHFVRVRLALSLTCRYISFLLQTETTSKWTLLWQRDRRTDLKSVFGDDIEELSAAKLSTEPLTGNQPGSQSTNCGSTYFYKLNYSKNWWLMEFVRRSGDYCHAQHM